MEVGWWKREGVVEDSLRKFKVRQGPINFVRAAQAHGQGYGKEDDQHKSSHQQVAGHYYRQERAGSCGAFGGNPGPM